MKKWIGKGINSDLRDSVSNNVLNIVRALIEDKESVVYIPNAYTNGSTYSVSADPLVHFYPSDCGKKISVYGLQSNQERYNFSMLGVVNVMVEDPRDDGTVVLLDKKVWRQYNIIRDGELTMDYICAVLSEESFNSLKKLGILYYNGVAVPENHVFKKEYVYKIMLKDLPLVSTSWAQPDNIGLYEYMIREKDLVETIKFLKTLRKEYNDKGIFATPSSEESDIYYEKHESGTERVSAPSVVDCITYTLEGIPDGTFDKSILSSATSIDEVEASLKKCNKELRYVRFISRCIVFAIENTRKAGSYDWTELAKVPRSKTKVCQKAAIEVDGNTYTLVRTIYKKSV